MTVEIFEGHSYETMKLKILGSTPAITYKTHKKRIRHKETQQLEEFSYFTIHHIQVVAGFEIRVQKPSSFTDKKTKNYPWFQPAFEGVPWSVDPWNLDPSSREYLGWPGFETGGIRPRAS
jgi:hypothetical protein